MVMFLRPVHMTPDRSLKVFFSISQSSFLATLISFVSLFLACLHCIHTSVSILFGLEKLPLVPIEHRLNATANLSIVADHIHPFMTTVYPYSDGYFQLDNAHVSKLK